MNTTIITLLAGFAGSLITLVITKLIEYQQSKQQREFMVRKDEADFEKELKKQFFARKLEVVEDFTKALTQLSAACQSGAQIYNSLKQGKAMDELESGKKMLEQAGDEQKSAMKTFNEKGSIVDLYFKVDAKPLLDVVARNQGLPMQLEIVSKEAMIHFNEGQRRKENNEEGGDEEIEIAKNKFKEMFSLAEKLEQMYYDMSNACVGLILEIQSRMKKFDY